MPDINIIVYADELPEASETSPAFVQTPDGTLYRKKAAEGGSLLGTWVFTDIPAFTSLGTGNNVFNINFLSNGQSYTSLTAYCGSTAFDPNKYIKYNNNTVFSASSASWTLDAFKTIQITDISSLTSVDEFTSWLTANATKQGGGATVSYSYVAVGAIYKHYITDDMDNRITIFTNSNAEMTEWSFGGETVILSFGKSLVSGNDGVLLYLDETDTTAPRCVFVTTNGTISEESLGSVASDEVTEV